MVVQLKQDLLNTSQEDRHWPGPEDGTGLGLSGSVKGNPHKATVPPTFIQSEARIYCHVLPVSTPPPYKHIQCSGRSQPF